MIRELGSRLAVRIGVQRLRKGHTWCTSRLLSRERSRFYTRGQVCLWAGESAPLQGAHGWVGGGR
jgi:hypothetical protein